MSVITGEYIEFVSAEPIYSKVKRFLKSFAGTNLIDEGEFPEYTYDVLRPLGMNVLQEERTLLSVKDYKTCLPTDFVKLLALYKCSPTLKVGGKDIPQNKSSVYYEVEKELYCAPKYCDIDCDSNTPLEKWTITTYVSEGPLTYNLRNPVLLRPGPNARGMCHGDCPNLFSNSPYEFTQRGREIIFNFSDDNVLMQYYSMPKDQEGNPLVPDEIELHKAIEWYIIYQVTLGWWMNNEVPDIQSKWQKAEQEYYDAIGNYKRYKKTPSVARLLNYIRNKRVINAVNAFSTNDRKRY